MLEPFADQDRETEVISAYVAALAVASELDLPAVLQRLTHLAREVVPARYAALGVADESGRIVEFITSGISPATRAAIGPLPQGHGMLGALITERRPLLVPDIASDPRSVGFPPNHPQMRTLLGVPILLGTRVLGNLYLTERIDDRPFDETDLRALQVLAAHAATTIERARLYAVADDARRQAEEQRDQLDTILNSLPTAVLLFDAASGRVEMANAAALALLSGPGPRLDSGQLPQPGHDYQLRQTDSSALPRELWPAVRAFSGDVVRNKQLTLELASGHQLPVLAQAAPLRDAYGTVTRAVVVYQDIARLREAEQLKDDFLSLVSHELRTPLTAIQGGAHLLANQREALAADDQEAILRDIVVESARLERTLTNMLTLTGVQAGRVEPTTEPILLGPLIARVLADARRTAPDHELAHHIDSSVPPVEGDPDFLAQVLRNLVENAVKYSPKGTTIRIEAHQVEGDILIEVIDEGYGIAPEHLPQVFERFRRPGAAPTTRGMGLGLYLSRHLVAAQGGALRVRSRGPGTGSTFTVTLPVSRDWLAAHRQAGANSSQAEGMYRDA